MGTTGASRARKAGTYERYPAGVVADFPGFGRMVCFRRPSATLSQSATPERQPVMSFAAGGVAGAILILACAIWRHDKHTRQDFYVATGLMWSLVMLGGVVFPALHAGHRALMDRTLYRADLAIGLDPWA